MADSEKYAPFLLDTELELPQLGRPCEKKGCQVTAQSSQIIKAPKMWKFARPVRVFVYWGYAGWSALQVCFVGLQLSVVAFFGTHPLTRSRCQLMGEIARGGVFSSGLVGFPHQKRPFWM